MIRKRHCDGKKKKIDNPPSSERKERNFYNVLIGVGLQSVAFVLSITDTTVD
jgi:hypothetical protein